MVLQRYISHLILGYVKRYIVNLEASVAFSLWGGDMLFNNLDVRLDVLQQSLGMPAAFSLSRGFIKELRLHIPWAAITAKPVEVTLTGVECALTFNPKAKDDPTQAAAGATSPPSTPHVDSGATGPVTPTAATSTSSAAAVEEDADASGGWASDLITKIIANLSITVNDLSLKYVEGSACACLRLQSLSLHSTDPSWRSSDFMDLLGPWKLIHKLVSIQHVSLFLYPDDGQQAPVKNEQVCILQQLSISARIKIYLAALGATADISSWSTNALATAVTPASLLPSSSSSPVIASSSSSSAPSSSSASSAAPPPLPPNAKGSAASSPSSLRSGHHRRHSRD